jgi:hypothetical protein
LYSEERGEAVYFLAQVRKMIPIGGTLAPMQCQRAAALQVYIAGGLLDFVTDEVGVKVRIAEPWREDGDLDLYVKGSYFFKEELDYLMRQ